MRLIDADKLLYDDIDCKDGHTYMVVRAFEIDSQPTIEVPQWIPCSERLPSSDGMFLVTVKSRSGKKIDLCHFNKNAKLDSNKWGGQYYNRNVIAWMPLPSVWKGENNAEK